MQDSHYITNIITGNLAANCDESRLILAKKSETLTLLPQLLKKYIEQLGQEGADSLATAAADHHDSFKDSDFGSSGENIKLGTYAIQDFLPRNWLIHSTFKISFLGILPKRAVKPRMFLFKTTGTTEDTAIKIIRVFANISINPEAGTIVALNEDIVGTLVDICQMDQGGTILLPTLATLNNLSFYPLVHQLETYQALKKFLHMPQAVAVCAETARVFGNLSRRPEIRQCFLQEGT